MQLFDFSQGLKLLKRNRTPVGLTLIENQLPAVC